MEKSNKPDYAYKAQILGNSELLHDAKLHSRELFQFNKDGDLNHLNLAFVLADKYNEDDFNEAKKLNSAYYNRTQKLRSRVRQMVETFGSDCTFLTLTFTDDVLNSTNDFTRKRYVSRFLKENCSMYIANIDFGAKNGREHYHAISSNPVDGKNWSCGAINFERIHNTGGDFTALSKYVSKLTNHAIKNTTRRAVIMYSRSGWEEV